MNYRCLWSLIGLAIIYAPAANAQSSLTPIAFEKEPAAAFSFVKDWAYPWNVIKDDNGKFAKIDGEEILPADTAHLYFTANCKTNVQGGYNIRYCYATKKGGNINLNFSDGSPAFASEFDILLVNNKFNFKPKIIYPELIPGEKISYKVTRGRLVLYQKSYAASKVIDGYITAEFVETALDVNKRPVHRKYYFRGYFRTAIKT